MKKVLIIIPIILLISALVLGLILINDQPFYLEDDYYQTLRIDDIFNDKLNMYIATHKSFPLVIYDSSENSHKFLEIIKSFQEEYQIAFNKIDANYLNNTELDGKITSFPAVVIYKEGNLKNYITYDKDQDLFTKEEFKKWFTKYINLRDIDPSLTTTTTKRIDVTLPSGIKKEDGKVNIYLFWGDGCPHCEEFKEFMDHLESDYQDLYNLYEFETWNDSNNKNLMDVFAEAMGDAKGKGVPYIIIGDQSFRGYSSRLDDSIKAAIVAGSKDDFDVYFDIIKENN